MKIKSTLLVFVIALFSVAACNAVKEKSVDPKKELEVISGLMSEQQSAWNRADLEGFMEHYWKSDSLKFIGKSGLTYGWQATLDNYKRGYPDASAMGRLQFTPVSGELLDGDHAFIIGKWELFRTADTLSGHYSLIWKKMNGKWSIVADHSS